MADKKKIAKKMKEKKLPSYKEYWDRIEEEEGPEKGLEDADFFPAESATPMGLIRKGARKGIKAGVKRAVRSNPKPGPALNYKNLGKSTMEKRNIPNWKRKLMEQGKPIVKSKGEL